MSYKWLKKGGGEFVGFAISMFFLTSILITIIGAVVLQDSLQYLNMVNQQLARDVIVCENIDDAQETAEKNAKEYFKYKKSISDEKVDVFFTPGSEEKWKKGNYITVLISVKIKSISPFTSGRYTSMVITMLERTEKNEWGF